MIHSYIFLVVVLSFFQGKYGYAESYRGDNSCVENLYETYTSYRNYVLEGNGRYDRLPYIDLSYIKGFSEQGKEEEYMRLYGREKKILQIDEYAGGCRSNKGYLKLKIIDEDARFERQYIRFQLKEDEWVIILMSKELGDRANDFDKSEKYIKIVR